MSRYNQSNTAATLQGTLLPASNVLVAKASRFAINTDDLLYLNGQGYVYPAQSTAWASPAGGVGGGNAGNALVAETDISTVVTATVNDAKNSMFVNPADQSFYVMAKGSSPVGVVIYKYSSAGTLLTALQLDSTTTDNIGAFNIVQLSNGNLVCAWATGGGVQNFAIVDTDLVQIVAKTALTGPSQASPAANYISVAALSAASGGGFAVAISAGAAGPFSTFFGIYTNAGVAVRAAAAITGTSQATSFAKCVQLSSGDIMIAIASATASQALGIATFTVAGAAGIPYAVVDNTTRAAPEQFEFIALVSGVVGIALRLTGTTCKLYVLNNAGVVQGAALTFTLNAGSATQFCMRTDGTYFWLIYQGAATGTWTFVRMPSTGTGQVTSTVSISASSVQMSDGFIERDYFVVWGVTSATIGQLMVFNLRSDGTASLALSSSPTTANPKATALFTFKPAGDFTCLAVTPADGTLAAKYRVWRYLDVAIFGVSKTTVAAGNAGSLVTASTGPIAQKINAITGPATRKFDQSAGNVLGNSGFLLQNSVSLKGY